MSLNYSIEDIENVLSQNNIILTSDELRVVKKRKLQTGFLETINIQRIRILRQIQAPVQQLPKQVVLNSICLTIEDIKRSKINENHWKVFNLKFRKVIAYGMAVIENRFTRDGEELYTISIDDETGVIMGTYKEYDKKKVIKQDAIFTREVNQLKRRRETGVNIQGKFYPSESEESQFVYNSVNNLQHMIEKNLKHVHKKFHQGPLKQKVLVYAKPFSFHDTTRLHIIDLFECDNFELTWKRNLNKIYSTQYIKQ